MKRNNFSSVIILADSYWDSMSYHAQNMAGEFLKRGYSVYFVERLPQRMPSLWLADLWQWLFQKGYGNDRIVNSRPANLVVLGFRSLPPMRCLRWLNRFILKRAFAAYLPKLQQGNSLLISYTPTYTQIDIARLVKPAKTVYINVHNYDADLVLPDLLRSEVEIINSDALLGADSSFNVTRLKQKVTTDKQVNRFAPGVHYDLFKGADKGIPSLYKSLYYFGCIGPHMDLDLYNDLAKTYEIVFIGVLDPRVKGKLSLKIKLLPAVRAQDLPALLIKADMLGVFYKKSPYIDGVMPAKFFECLATGKPLFVSGMDETKPYADVVYDCDNNARKALSIIAALPQTETMQKIALRQQIAQGADWARRFDEVMK